MSSRLSFLLAVILLLAAAILRLHEFATLPGGLNDAEITDLRIVETARDGRIEVFYNLGDEGREGLYHIAVAAVTSLTGHGIIGYRLLSVWVGLLALALLYAIGVRLFGHVAALSALALLAFGFWPVLLARLAIHQTVLPMLISGVLLGLATTLPVYWRKRSDEVNSIAAAALGAFLGFGFYFHPVGVLAVIIAVIFILYMVFSRQRISRRRQSFINFALLLVIIFAVPYLTSSIRLPELNGATRLVGEFADISLESAFDSIAAIAIYGSENPAYNLPGRPLFDPISATLMAIGLVAALLAWRQPRYTLLLIALVVLTPSSVLAESDSLMVSMVPLLPVLALFFGLGVNIVLSVLSRRGAQVAGAGLVVLLGATLVVTVNDLFIQWPERDDVQTAYNARLGTLALHIDRSADDIPTVVCGWRVDQSPNASDLTPAQLIDLMSNRRNAPVRYVDCRAGLVMTNGGGFQQVILPDPEIIETAHPQVQRWLLRGSWVEDHALPPRSIIEMEVTETLANALGIFTVTTPVSYAPEVGGGDLFNPPVSFGGNLTLLGYIPENTAGYVPGSIVTLVSFWRADGPVPPDLRLFTHILLDPGASPPANTDTIAVAPAGLRDRDVFVQVTYIPLPLSLPAGEYRVSIGAYQDSSDERLFVLDGGQPRGTRLFLYTMQVAAPDIRG